MAVWGLRSNTGWATPASQRKVGAGSKQGDLELLGGVYRGITKLQTHACRAHATVSLRSALAPKADRMRVVRAEPETKALRGLDSRHRLCLLLDEISEPEIVYLLGGVRRLSGSQNEVGATLRRTAGITNQKRLRRNALMEQHSARFDVAMPFRGVRIGETPTISVVITSRAHMSRLDACLETLLPQATAVDAQLIVVRIAEAAEAHELGRKYPDVHVIAVNPDVTLPQMRVLGMAEATGDIVLLGQDDREGEEWFRARIFAKQRTGVSVE